MFSRSPDDLVPALRDAWPVGQATFARQNAPHTIELTCTKRDPKAQAALFAQGRKQLVTVNALMKLAGLPPITAEQNLKCVTWVQTSRHFPNADGLAEAFDFCVEVDPDGPTGPLKPIIEWDDQPMYIAAQEIFRAMGFGCGMDFKKANGKPQPDLCHIETVKNA